MKKARTVKERASRGEGDPQAAFSQRAVGISRCAGRSSQDRAEMMAELSFVFAMEIDGKPILAFEAKNSREASGLCKEEWLRSDLSVLKSNGVPLWSAGAKLKVRQPNELETQIYEAAKRDHQATDDLLLVYLVKLDELAPDEQPVDPGAFSTEAALICLNLLPSLGKIRLPAPRDCYWMRAGSGGPSHAE